LETIQQNQGKSVFKVFVVYVQPEFVELECRFPNYLNSGYKTITKPGRETRNQDRRLVPIEFCKNVSTKNREILFEYVRINDLDSFSEVMGLMFYNKVRPALYEELMSFDKAYPDERLKHRILALGSITRFSEAPFLCKEGLGLQLYDTCDNHGFNGSYRFLAVRE